MMRTFIMLLAASLAVPRGTAAEAQGPGAPLDGVYLAWRTTTTASTPEQEYLTFFPDGKVYHDAPDEGLAQPLDWARACQNTQCGTYRVAANTVVVHWSSGSEQRFQREAGGVLKLEGTVRRFHPLASLYGERLEGVYAHVNVGGEVAVGITFSRQGEFREFNLLPYTNWVMRGDPVERRSALVGEGWGRYSIRRNTLELRYSNGLVARLMIAVPPGASTDGDPSTIYVNRTALDRKR